MSGVGCWNSLRLRPFPLATLAMIQVKALTKLYGEFIAVNELDFEVQPGEVMGLVGPNGAGKTTTLRCLAGIIPPTRGSIRICGHDLAQDPIAAKQQLAFFTDEPRLFDYLTVQQHLVFTARIYQVPHYEPLADQLLQELELAGKKNAVPGGTWFSPPAFTRSRTMNPWPINCSKSWSLPGRRTPSLASFPVA